MTDAADPASCKYKACLSCTPTSGPGRACESHPLSVPAHSRVALLLALGADARCSFLCTAVLNSPTPADTTSTLKFVQRFPTVVVERVPRPIYTLREWFGTQDVALRDKTLWRLQVEAAVAGVSPARISWDALERMFVKL